MDRLQYKYGDVDPATDGEKVNQQGKEGKEEKVHMKLHDRAKICLYSENVRKLPEDIMTKFLFSCSVKMT